MIYDFRNVGDFRQNDIIFHISYKQKSGSASGRPKRPTLRRTTDFNELNFVLMNVCHVFLWTLCSYELCVLMNVLMNFMFLWTLCSYERVYVLMNVFMCVFIWTRFLVHFLGSCFIWEKMSSCFIQTWVLVPSNMGLIYNFIKYFFIL